jgi:hypothetical protein
MKTKKTTGLSSFTKLKREGENIPIPDAPASRQPMEPTRAKGKVVHITVRLTPNQWERLHELAVSRRMSIQALALEGFSRIFEEMGLPRF